LSHAQLRSYGDLLLELANDNILPILHILYPQALATLRTAKASGIGSLHTFDWTLPYDEQLFLLESLADAVKGRIDDARNTSGQSVAPIGVLFPKPTAPGTPVPDLPGFVVAAPARLAAVCVTRAR